jgi:hypothetical protein
VWTGRGGGKLVFPPPASETTGNLGSSRLARSFRAAMVATSWAEDREEEGRRKLKKVWSTQQHWEVGAPPCPWDHSVTLMCGFHLSLSAPTHPWSPLPSSTLLPTLIGLYLPCNQRSHGPMTPTVAPKGISKGLDLFWKFW